jgi:uncharacterized protein with PQ loop repeat
VVQINSSLLTITFYSSVIAIFVNKNAKDLAPFMTLKPTLTAIRHAIWTLICMAVLNSRRNNLDLQMGTWRIAEWINT